MADMEMSKNYVLDSEVRIKYGFFIEEPLLNVLHVHSPFKSVYKVLSFFLFNSSLNLAPF